MPEEITSGVDGTPAAGTPPVTPAPGSTTTPPERTFTQAELDNILQDRLKRAVPEDYESLKADAARFKEAEAEKLTELEKAQAEAKAAKDEAAETLATANARVRQSAIIGEAATQNAADPEMIAVLLGDSTEIVIDASGLVVGATEAVKKLLASKPFLVKIEGKGPPAKSGGEFKGDAAKSKKDQIKAAQEKGDWKESARLKVAGFGG